MKTLRLAVDPAQLNTAEAQEALEQAAAILRAGGLVALPTETVYGLGANALDAAAVERIFAAKQRPSWDPIIVHIADEAMLEGLVEQVPDAARRLMMAYWPGPLTLLLPRSSTVPDAVTAGRPLVGVRMPAHPVALELIRRAGVPVAAPSANLFSHISPTTAAHVLADLDGRIDAVVDAGPTEHGVESTVLDPCQTPMMIYRPGAVTRTQIQDAAGAVELYRDDGALRPSRARRCPRRELDCATMRPRRGWCCWKARWTSWKRGLPGCCWTFPKNRWASCCLPRLPRRRELRRSSLGGDGPLPRSWRNGSTLGCAPWTTADCTVILCPVPPAEGIGAAIRDRLLKAGTKD